MIWVSYQKSDLQPKPKPKSEVQAQSNTAERCLIGVWVPLKTYPPPPDRERERERESSSRDLRDPEGTRPLVGGWGRPFDMALKSCKTGALGPGVLYTAVFKTVADRPFFLRGINSNYRYNRSVGMLVENCS